MSARHMGQVGALAPIRHAIVHFARQSAWKKWPHPAPLAIPSRTRERVRPAAWRMTRHESVIGAVQHAQLAVESIG